MQKKIVLNSANNLVGFCNNEVLNTIKKLDVVAISAIYTQLFYNWALSLLKEYKNNYDNKAYNKILDSVIYLRNQIVFAFNNSIFGLC